jgi:hypothetical protein
MRAPLRVLRVLGGEIPFTRIALRAAPAVIHHEAHEDHEGFYHFIVDLWCGAAVECAHHFVSFVGLVVKSHSPGLLCAQNPQIVTPPAVKVPVPPPPPPLVRHIERLETLSEPPTPDAI